jgi:hypothetical protein
MGGRPARLAARGALTNGPGLGPKPGPGRLPQDKE